MRVGVNEVSDVFAVDCSELDDMFEICESALDIALESAESLLGLPSLEICGVPCCTAVEFASSSDRERPTRLSRAA
jgi:hypothetical protein